MADHVFYEQGRKRGNTRSVIIKGARLLPGRAPSNIKRIVIPVVMPLSNEKTTGQPDWIADAHAYVAKSHETSVSKVRFDGFDIDFATENRNLFGDEKISAPRCSMRGFSVHEQGKDEDPDIVCSFAIYAQFSTSLWAYLGQVSNDPIWARFSQASIPEEDEQVEFALGEEEEDEAEEEDDSNQDYGDEFEDEEDIENDAGEQGGGISLVTNRDSN